MSENRLPQLQLIFELVKRREDYLVKQEEQSINIAKQLVTIAGISAFPAILGNVREFNTLGIVLITIGLTFIAGSAAIGCFDLARPHQMSEIDTEKFRDTAYSEATEEFLLTIADQMNANLEERTKSEEDRIKILKFGYVLYAISIVFIVMAFAFK